MRSSDRLLDLLEQLSGSHRAALTELSVQLQLPKPTVLRFLRSLEERAWAIRLPDGGYALGPHFLTTAQKAIGDDAVLRCASPHMVALRDLLDETVSLLSVAGASRVCTVEYRSPQPLRCEHEIGMRAPLHAGPSGKILLAFGPVTLR